MLCMCMFIDSCLLSNGKYAYMFGYDTRTSYNNITPNVTCISCFSVYMLRINVVVLSDTLVGIVINGRKLLGKHSLGIHTARDYKRSLVISPTMYTSCLSLESRCCNSSIHCMNLNVNVGSRTGIRSVYSSNCDTFLAMIYFNHLVSTLLS
jgi:hypothetical protein